MESQSYREKFLKILDDHKGIVFKICNAYCKDPEDRKDLVQEIIYQLWRSYKKYDDRYKLSTWIYRIALNIAISHYRQKSRKHPHITIDENLIEQTSNVDDSVQGENIRHLYQLINQLDKLNKALIILYLDNNSYRDIAEILGISETNVATKLNRIKQKLKKQFANV